MDPLADLVDWIALYGIVGLFSIGLAERFVPALPSYGVLVAIGIAANDDVWSIHTAVVGTTVGSFMGALSLYVLVRAFGKQRSASTLYTVGKWLGLSRQRIDLTISSLRGRERLITTTSQLIPTIRLISPLAAGLLGTSVLKFATGLAVGIVLWNGLFIAAGYLAVTVLPGINSSAFALKTLVLLVAVELLVALIFRLQLRSSKRLRREGDAQ
ncbi:SNARE associated domain-containing protein (plasmid) [Rhizobium etli bv. mimosae str. IE4771]|uniref:SNARE associated domain-containing protein n=1 Tax=Rhizobium etli bv. mimosae str. IE4771 TaxID=1432050 RepID=A0A060IFJ1_RHIET|nr:VTT domain-containing protein [Rhizobium sp. IE4771]AIC30426.1 SNARE associated domain-containing protein [Rhizobium sp. IE4771]